MLKLKSNERRLYSQATGTALLRVCSSVKHASFHEKKPCINYCLSLCFYMCLQDFFAKTCLEQVVKHFHMFKFKSVLYSYCLITRISVLVSEEARQFVDCLDKVAYFTLK